MSTRNLTLDLHAIYKRGTLIEAALDGIVREAEEKRAARVEIICGKGSGQLKNARTPISGPEGHQGEVPPCEKGRR